MKRKITKETHKSKETQTDFNPITLQNIFIMPGHEDQDDPDYLPDDDSEDSLDKLKRCYTHKDYEYYDKLPKKKKKYIDRMEENIDKVDFFQIPMRFRILESPIDIKLKQLAIQKIDELSMMFPGSGDYFKLKTWVENLCKLPIGKFKNLPVSKSDSIDKIAKFMESTKTKFDKLVYGHTEAKTQIIQLLAKLISNPTANGIVIGIHGPPGTGKTTILNNLSECLDIPYGFISLAGITDQHVFRGFSMTYESSRWGKIADILMKTQVMNPILYFDELDKISTSHHGEEVANFLVHLSDFSQNFKFQDHYFADIDLDLSKCIILFSYNNEELINPVLKDRMITIKVNGYNINDKITLAKEHILPKIMTEFGFSEDDLLFDDTIIEYLINKVDEEEGARNMKRGLEEIVGSLNYKKLLAKITKFPLKITKDIIDELLITNKKKDEHMSKHMMYL
jgi:ATP-dependent Lon protease